MLINSGFSFSKDDILALKNILGEEIICTFVSVDDTYYTIKKPFAMAMTQNGPAFAPAVMFGDMDGDIQVYRDHFLWAVKGNAEITAAYTQQVSGIAVPQQNTKIIT